MSKVPNVFSGKGDWFEENCFSKNLMFLLEARHVIIGLFDIPNSLSILLLLTSVLYLYTRNKTLVTCLKCYFLPYIKTQLTRRYCKPKPF